ncbi:uncharacterized protein MICPUCDRAFT_54914 [Micromonas pusilla CCMP1545]|uniref:Predicted protein n=1 Tax=Micromonas pusilla (strain CCMP1545) TaxID=564608 RepID=C1NAH8_MICPC|nr:uncharacterized protein MICPUCDRAFT_54914 [Micromonas pusilla CCMP1545]EEH50941.1 predicted protein [Micromonas pusilla CCMP1545]|eukprot:XP_003064961.1 predicted protein [Micromonas pusilla CCMP1545]
MDTPSSHTPGSTAVARTRTRPPPAADKKFETKDILSSFKNDDKFSFDGPSRHQDGDLFLARFEGALRTSCVDRVRAIFEPRNSADDVFSVPENINAIIFHALLTLTDGLAVRIVLRYTDARTGGDGLAALTALRRLITRAADKSLLPSLRKHVYSIPVPAPLSYRSRRSGLTTTLSGFRSSSRIYRWSTRISCPIQTSPMSTPSGRRSRTTGRRSTSTG